MIKINLLPKEARKRVGLGEQIFIIVFVLVATFTGIGLYWSYQKGVIEQKQDDIARTKQRLQELQKIIDEIEKFEAQRKALEQKLEVIAKLEKEQRLPVRFLDELYLTLEDDLWLTSFQQSGRQLSVSGSALSNPVLSNYLRKLEVSPYFDNIELVISQSKQIGSRVVRDFQINMVLTPPEMKEEGKDEGEK
jgi:type IV pilus assembly protein PilN